MKKRDDDDSIGHAAMQYVTVELTAKSRNGKLLLLDKSGRRIAVIEASDAGQMSAVAIEDMQHNDKWRNWLSAMNASLAGTRCRLSADEWDRKCNTWVRSVRMRHNRLEASIAAYERRKSRWRETHDNWDCVLDKMVKKDDRVKSKRHRRRNDHWSIWLDTVLSNLKHRRKRSGDKDSESANTSAVACQTGAEQLQMHFVWRTVESSECLA